jgi:S-methylmethionine-dependent homocysteine/selenocysteine methylase
MATSALEQLNRRLANGEIVILDGGMGSELEAQGVPMDGAVWSGIAAHDHQDAVRRIHEDFIDAGADVIITNTFSSNRLALEPAGLGDLVAKVNRQAVDAALQARENAAERPIVVAGSLSPHSAYGMPATEPPPDVILAGFREQASLLAEAGVDLLALEMIPSLAYGRPAVQAATETGLPVWVGVTSWSDAFREGRFGELVGPLVQPGVTAVNVMHTELEAVSSALDEVGRHWTGTLGVYPHVGDWEPPNWTLSEIAPDAFAAEAETWVARGAQLVGGCCGIRPAHIRALREALPERLPVATR